MSKGVQKVLDQCKPRYRAPSKTEYVLLFIKVGHRNLVMLGLIGVVACANRSSKVWGLIRRCMWSEPQKLIT